MEELPSNIMLKFNPNTLEEVRRDVGLDIQSLNEALDILEAWVKKQAHFTKKDFSRDYLERTLFTTKGSIEKAKQKIDKICTMKTLMPEFFVFKDPREDFQDVDNIICQAHIPKLTKENCRVYILKIYTDDFNSSVMFKYYLKTIMLTEYLKRYEYCSGFHIIADIQEANILSLVTRVSPVELKNFMTILTDGYGMRTKGIHILTQSKMVDTIVTFLKQVLTPKLASRVHIHKTVESLYEHVPKDVLPVDLGGTEKSLRELSDEWLDVIDTEEYKNYYKEIIKANTDESRRPRDTFNQEHIGTPGSFRTLTVD